MKPVVCRQHRLDGRTVVVSDVHADPEGLAAVLAAAQYTPADTLLLLGDLIEKGPNSLGLLRMVMDLAQKGRVLAVKGNCDDALCEVARAARGEETQWMQDLPRYLSHQKHSIIREMAAQCGLEDLPGCTLQQAARVLYPAFRREMDFVLALPELIETERFVFVHAGLGPGPLAEQKREDCLVTEAFAEQAAQQGLRFEKYVVTGHWPTCNYYHQRPSYAPVVDECAHIIAIDGGNSVKAHGVLHALIIEDGGAGGFRFVTHDAMPRARALDDQAASPEEPLAVTWADRRVQPLEWRHDRAQCRHLLTNHILWVPINQMVPHQGGWAALDSTDYHLPLPAGSEVRLLQQGPLGALVRRGMDAGWYTGRLEMIE